MQATTDEEDEQKLGKLSSSVLAPHGDDHRQATSGSVQHVEDGAAAIDPTQRPAATPDLCEANTATADKSGDTGTSDGAAADAAVLDSTGSTAAPGTGIECGQDIAEGNSGSVQVDTFAVWTPVCGFSALG